MKKCKLIIILLFGYISLLFAQNPYGSVKNHKLDVKIDYEKKKLYAKSELTILNETKNEISNIPLILYRLLKVTSVSIDGKSISFNQEVKSFEDFSVLQVNSIQLILNKPIPVNTSSKIEITYDGNLLGYSETGLNYVKDHINYDFTILRPDCLAYPVIGTPEFSTLKMINRERFNYTIKVSVPKLLTVVNGGTLVSKILDKNVNSYTYKSIKPTSQIVTTIAKYKKLTTNKVSTFYFEKDSLKAKKVHGVLLNTFDLYSIWWGKLKGEHSFSLIEIPEGYGSQATENYIIQTASAFNKKKQLRQLYHEISHLWNVDSNDEYPTRFNEGLATFIEYKTVKKLEKRNDLDIEVERIYKIVKSDEKYSEVALMNYGEKNLTDRSYTIGFLFFYILHEIVGEDEFNQLIKSFYKDYYATGATTIEFINYLKRNSKLNLQKLCDDWIYTSNYHNHLKKYSNLSDLVLIYNSN